MSDKTLYTWQEFFAVNGSKFIQTDAYQNLFTIEDIYQVFKERLRDEVEKEWMGDGK